MGAELIWKMVLYLAAQIRILCQAEQLLQCFCQHILILVQPAQQEVLFQKGGILAPDQIPQRTLGTDAALAELERENILERQAEGIAIAKAEGRMTGRPKKAVDSFERVYLDVKTGKKAASQGARELGIARSTWYRKVKEYESEYVDF